MYLLASPTCPPLLPPPFFAPFPIIRRSLLPVAPKQTYRTPLSCRSRHASPPARRAAPGSAAPHAARVRSTSRPSHCPLSALLLSRGVARQSRQWNGRGRRPRRGLGEAARQGATRAVARGSPLGVPASLGRGGLAGQRRALPMGRRAGCRRDLGRWRRGAARQGSLDVGGNAAPAALAAGRASSCA